MADNAVYPRESFARHCRDRTPHALVVDAASMVGASVKARALDIGAGSLSSSRHLLSAGFTVDAVDTDPHAGELVAALEDSRISMHCCDIRDFENAGHSYGLIAAIHVLHLIPRRDLVPLVTRIATWLDEGAIFCATFLGPHDSWAPTPWRATVLSIDEVLDLGSGLDVIRLEELEHDGTNVLGQPKHWHTFSCLFRRPATR